MYARQLLITLIAALALAAPAAAQDGGTWTPAGNLNVPRTGATAVALNNGKILVVGGNNDRTKSAEVFDPATGTWTLTGPMNAPQ